MVASPKPASKMVKAASAKKSAKKPAKKVTKEKVAKKECAKKEKKAKKTGPYTQWKGESIPLTVPARRKATKGNSFTAIAWNVGGLRSFIEKKKDTLIKLMKEEKPDLLALAEHKLQESHVEDFTKKFGEMFPEYESHWSVSTEKKGYSGVVVLTKKSDDVKEVTMGLLGKKDTEGIKTWDPDFRKHVNKLKKPVVAIGDFNAAHLDVDIWNVEAPHIPKSAGTTTEERESFGKLLSECNLTDTWRHLHGADTLGHFTYWSVRARNRGTNRGLVLDYALVSDGTEIEDSFALPDFAPTGDHCPVGARVCIGGKTGATPKKSPKK